jgi:preprotein translocase subunit SecD
MKSRSSAGVVVALVSIALGALLFAGCAPEAKPASSVTDPVTAGQLPHGKMPGVEFVALSALVGLDQDAVKAWRDAGSPAAAAPTLKHDSYQPFLDAAHVAEVAETASFVNGRPAQGITFKLDSAGTQTFADYTGKHTGGTILIVLDDRVLLAPVIDEQITNGELSVTGAPSTIDAIARAIVAK